jgi:DNA-binding NarL/FixJ family response regulator
MRPDIPPAVSSAETAALTARFITQPSIPPLSSPNMQPKPKESEAAKTPSKRLIRAHIDLLVNEGLSPEEIASRLDISIAEVNLAMNLLKRK